MEKEPTLRGNNEKAFDEAEKAIGKYWDNVPCICQQLLNDRCEKNCPEHEDNGHAIDFKTLKQ